MTKILELLVLESGLPVTDVSRLIATAPERYKVFQIPKKNGGLREIAQPAREIKMLQRILIQHLLLELPVHEAASAYRAGASIRSNALAHAGDSPILKIDFESFFPSLREDIWRKFASNHTKLDNQEIQECASIFFRRAKGERTLRLSIGAPSSPWLSNILLYSFDTYVAKEAEVRGIRYTRYADDMTFSGQRIGMLKDMLGVVQIASKQNVDGVLKINRDKTRFATMSGRRFVTGVILTNEGDISLGRDRKRLIAAKIHHALSGRLNDDQLKELSGQLGFANAVEPRFIARMVQKYGIDQIRSIQKGTISIDLT